jgi:hypothetical protein
MSYLGIIINERNLGFAAIFACISIGFAVLRTVDKGNAGIAAWSLSFSCNGLGFLLWSNILPIPRWQLYLVGDLLHVAGFILLVFGAFRFFGNAMSAKAAVLIAACAAFWLASVSLLFVRLDLAVFMLRLLRSLIFVSAGIWILSRHPKERLIGKSIAGASMMAWGLYIVITAVWRLVSSTELQFGILAGFHVLAAFGMVAMVVDRIRLRAEEGEQQLSRLEGLLPICSYCKKIRDDGNKWQSLETYIEERSTAEFSHGICPECMKKHFPT